MIRRPQILNHIVFVLILLFLCSFQTSFWFQIAGSVVAPLLWLNVILYVILYRPRVHAIFFNYFLALVLAPFTSMSFGSLLLLLLILTVSISYIKDHLFWSNTRYFVMASLGATLAFQILIMALSHWLEGHFTGWNPLARLTELILTPFFAAPMYWLLQSVDNLVSPDAVPEQGSRLT